MCFRCFLRIEVMILKSAMKMADIGGKRSISWKERYNLMWYEV